MHPFLLIPIYIFIGYLLKKTGIGKESLALWLNRIVINICLPSLALLKVPRLQASSALLFPASVAWVVFFVAFLFMLVLSWRLCLDNSTKGSFLLCCGLFNSAFVGFPMVQALYGDHALSVAIITDQLGSFLVLSTAGLFAAAYYSGSHISYKSFFARIFSFAPFWAFLVALFLKFSDLEIPNIFNPILNFLSSLLTPLALVAVGLQLNFLIDRNNVAILIKGLFYKLIIAPMIIFLIVLCFQSEHNLLLKKVCVIQSATPPMVSGSILAIRNRLNPPLSAAFVGIGLPLSFVTIPLWFILLEIIF